VRVRVWTPVQINRETRELFDRLKAVEGEPPAAEPSGKRFWERVRDVLGGG
jgi:hypothetical protein